MMNFYKYCLLLLLILTSSLSCTDQRDLHVSAKPLFIIKNDWSAAQIAPETATAMFYARANPCELMTNSALRHKLYLDPAIYDILVFNEAMISESYPGLDGIAYRNTKQFNTFGAYAQPSSVNSVFKSAPDEIMVGYGYPEPLAARTFEQKEVLTQKQYVMKYQDGVNGFPTYKDFDADSAEFLPIRVTRDVKIIAHIKNFQKGFRVSATLRGFAEGVLLATRQPDGANAAYVCDLNNATPDPAQENGYIIVSPIFTTFGPWWNHYPDDRRYMLDFVAMKNTELFHYSFDVTELSAPTITRSVSEAMTRIKAEEEQFRRNGTLPQMETIIIEVWFELPFVEGSIDVGVGDWGSDIIISIPI